MLSRQCMKRKEFHLHQAILCVAVVFFLSLAYSLCVAGEGPTASMLEGPGFSQSRGQVLTAARLGQLKVSENRRFLVQADGRPFFYLGDTAWELFHRLNREEVDRYLTSRARHGFTVIQAVALAELDGLSTPNAYGHCPLIGNDPTRPDVKDGPDNDYWDHVDYIIQRSRDLGLYIGLLPTWGDKWNQKRGTGPVIFTPENAEIFGRWLGKRCNNAGNIIWILGGDRVPENDTHKEIIRAMARGLAQGDNGQYLMTFHPSGGGQSSGPYFGADTWLDFNMLQSGHRPTNTNYMYVERDYALTPIKPCMDGEPCYEAPPGVGDRIVRRHAYCAVFAGAHGHTYGAHPIWQMHDEGRQYKGAVTMFWHQSLDLPGTTQLIHLKRLMLSRPFLTRIPDQNVVISESRQDIDRIQVTRDGRPGQDDATYIMAYFPRHQQATLKTSLISATTLRGWWYDPRTGEATLIGEMPREDTKQFAPPIQGEDQDWVLVLDDAAKHYSTPGHV